MARVLDIAVIVCLPLAGCGVYTFSPKGKSDIKSIAVERFENETAEYGLEDRMTDLVIDALIADGSLKVVELQYADAVLTGILVSYDRRAYSFDENDQVQSYKVTMGFNIALKKPADDSEIWNERMSQIGVYDTETETEEDGRQKAVDLLVEAILNKTTKSW